MWKAVASSFTYKGIGKFHTLTKSEVNMECQPVFWKTDSGFGNAQLMPEFTWANSQPTFIPENTSNSSWNKPRDLLAV